MIRSVAGSGQTGFATVGWGPTDAGIVVSRLRRSGDRSRGPGGSKVVMTTMASGWSTSVPTSCRVVSVPSGPGVRDHRPTDPHEVVVVGNQDGQLHRAGGRGGDAASVPTGGCRAACQSRIVLGLASRSCWSPAAPRHRTPRGHRSWRARRTRPAPRSPRWRSRTGSPRAPSRAVPRGHRRSPSSYPATRPAHRWWSPEDRELRRPGRLCDRRRVLRRIRVMPRWSRADPEGSCPVSLTWNGPPVSDEAELSVAAARAACPDQASCDGPH